MSTNYREDMTDLPCNDLEAGDPAARILGVTVVRAGRAALQRVEAEALRPLGISYSGYQALMLLWSLGPHEPWELARLLGVSVPSATSLINTLERQGHVTRERSTVDGRLVIVSITDSGIETACRAQSGVRRLEATVASALSREEQKAMQGYLDRYLAAIGEQWAEKSQRPFNATPEVRERYRVLAEAKAPRTAKEAALLWDERTNARRSARRR